MQIEIYRHFAAAKPDMECCLRKLIGPLAIQQGNHPDFSFEEWVGQFVREISVAPSNQATLAYSNTGRVTDPKRTQYVVFYHVDSPGVSEGFGARHAYQADSPAQLGWTLGCIQGKHAAELAAPGAQLFIDLIVEHDTVRTEGVRYYTEEFVLYYFDPSASRAWLSRCPPVNPESAGQPFTV